MRKSILFVFPVFPYPARLNGISVRYTPILEWLRDKYVLHADIVAGENDHIEDITPLKSLCTTVRVLKRQKQQPSLALKISRRMSSLLSPKKPYLLQYHDEQTIKHFFSARLTPENDELAAVIWVSAAYLDIGIEVFGGTRILFDAIDSIYLNRLRKTKQSLLEYIDLWHLRQWEKGVPQRVHNTVFISPIDANAASKRAAEEQVEIIPNGVYLADIPQHIETVKNTHVITLGFIGHMGYAPNIEAASRLAWIFEQLHKIDDRYRLLIIGRDPAPEVLGLQTKTITVTGTVDNIWEYTRMVDYFVFPMLSGAGQQNKVLEAMYAEKPVICNATANSGIGAVGGVHLQLCETDQEFVDAIDGLTQNPQLVAELAREGCAFVMKNYAWATLLPKYEQLLLATVDQPTVAPQKYPSDIASTSQMKP